MSCFQLIIRHLNIYLNACNQYLLILREYRQVWNKGCGIALWIVVWLMMNMTGVHNRQMDGYKEAEGSPGCGINCYHWNNSDISQS